MSVSLSHYQNLLPQWFMVSISKSQKIKGKGAYLEEKMQKQQHSQGKDKRVVGFSVTPKARNRMER